VPDNKRIDHYEILDVLGKGAMGAVYRAWDPKLRRDVAVKVVAHAYAGGEKGRERFHREVCAIAALRHPNIVEIYDYSGMESEHLYYVMEKLEGRDLFNILQAKGPMPETIVAAVGNELCLALAVAHEAGIIHRDLKPENVFIDANARVVLTDFGVVKAVRQDSAVEGFGASTEVIGTPGFMAPELLMSKQLGAYTDIFALGALLYNVLTGHMPYEGNSPVEMHRAILNGKLVDPRAYIADLSDDLRDVLARCLDAKPKKRYQSADEMRQALKSVLDANGVTDLRDDLRDYVRDAAAYTQAAARRGANRLVERLKVAVKDKDGPAVRRLQSRLQTIDPENSEAMSISGVFNVAKLKTAAKQARVEAAAAVAGARPPEERARDVGQFDGGVARSGRAWRVVLAVLVLLLAVGGAGVGYRLYLVPQSAATDGLAPARNPLGEGGGKGARSGVTAAPGAATAGAGPSGAATAGATDVAAAAAPSAAPGTGVPVAALPAAAAAVSDPSARPGFLQVRVLRGAQVSVSVDGTKLDKAEWRSKRLAPGRHRVDVAGKRKSLSLEVDVPPAVTVVVQADLRKGKIAVSK